jgi:hypothetical protein
MRETYLISFDLSEYKLAPMNIPAHPDLTVGDILDTLYFRISDEFPLEPYTYGERWVLEKETGERMEEMGTVWARHHGRDRDERVISEVGLKPGSIYRVKKII